MRKKKVYLDYAASTPLDQKVLAAMLPYLRKEFGNPSSAHSFGQVSRVAIEEARGSAARFLSCKPGEIVFCSGATEANNLAIQGLVRASAAKAHLVTSSFEHESVLSVMGDLEDRGEADVTYVNPDREGIVQPEAVLKAVRKNTLLVSVMYANSEIGTIQPIAQIAKAAKKKSQNVYVHTDAVQAALSLDCDVRRLQVDLLTLSGHKVYGPKGVGVLFVKQGTVLNPILLGGGQENSLRSGTENVAAIVGMGAALLEVSNGRTQISGVRIRQLRDKLFKMLVQRVPDMQIHGTMETRLPSNINVRVPGILGSDLVIALDQRGFAIATGSACTERTEGPSHVICALGVSEQDALGAIRITLGKHTTAQDVEKFAKAFASAVSYLKPQR